MMAVAARTFPDARKRILILFDNVPNLHVLRDALSPDHDVVTDIDFLDLNAERGPFDLCIVDSESLKRFAVDLRGLRERFAPLLLPVLALVERRARGMTRQIWEIADDVLMRPVERDELETRVQSLLRLRAMSIALSSVGDHLEHERRIATRLQEAALPALPRLPGVVLDAVYRAGKDEANVGGDWYDAFQVPDGRIVLTIGDVTGSGLEAAVTMTSVRQSLRAIAFLHAEPAAMLDAADRALRASDPDRIVTAFVAVLDRAVGRLRFASAGHPRPFIRYHDGSVVQLVNDGIPLGVDWNVPRVTSTTHLASEDCLLLYTDGLIEANRDAIAAEESLEKFVRRSAFRLDDNVARRVDDYMLAGLGNDDVAILTLRPIPDANILRWEANTGDERSVHRLQSAFAQALATHGMRAGRIIHAETILAELIGNIVRHAAGACVVILDRGVGAPVLHVLDDGPGFERWPRLPFSLLDESGRGLYLVEALASGFTVERRARGGSHVRVVLKT